MADLENWPPTSRERLVALFDTFRASFGSLSALAMGLGLLAGLGLPEVDAWLRAQVPLFDFSTEEAARSMLETIATVTVSVAGIAFSVTIVAFTLSTNQLSPRVLRSFRRDLISQLTLAAFLGTFVYCLALLARLGSLGGGEVPSISIAVAVLLALGSLALFAVFIGHIASMLQPASVIASIAADSRPELSRPYPAGVGAEPEDGEAARRAAERRMRAGPGHGVECEGEGYLTVVSAGEIVAAAPRRRRARPPALPDRVLPAARPGGRHRLGRGREGGRGARAPRRRTASRPAASGPCRRTPASRCASSPTSPSRGSRRGSTTRPRRSTRWRR